MNAGWPETYDFCYSMYVIVKQFVIYLLKMPKYTYWYYSGSLHTCTKTFRIKIWLEAIGEPSLLQCTLLTIAVATA